MTVQVRRFMIWVFMHLEAFFMPASRHVAAFFGDLRWRTQVRRFAAGQVVVEKVLHADGTVHEYQVDP